MSLPVLPNAPAPRPLPGKWLVLAVAAVALLAGCTEEPAPDPVDPDPVAGEIDANPDAAPDASPDGEPEGELTAAELRRIAEENTARKVARRKEMDKKARGLMKSFRSRAYDPLRDAGLLRLRATATLQTPAVTATYAVTFDGEQEPDEQVEVTPVSEPKGTPDGSRAQVVRYANHSLRGGYQTVAHWFPPTQMLFTRTADGARLVTAQPWKQNVQVSYRIDREDLVEARGTNAPRGQEVVEFEWRFFKGRYLLEKSKYKGTKTVIEFDYVERDGVALLSKATLVRGAQQVVTTFEYEAIEKGEPETPLVPEIVGPDQGNDAERPK